MVENLEVAKQLAEAFKESFAAIDRSAAIVREKCSKEEVDEYLKAIAPVCGEIIFSLMEPLYARHPGLKPLGWDK
jgi:hypothetical protein